MIATTLQMTWADLAFLHWPMPLEPVRARLPAGLELDTYDGTAWLGITPFEMRDVRLSAMPPLPTVSRFLELNVRTYVTHNGRAGVYFFSLDAASLLAVVGARAATGLPYFHARMSASGSSEITYASHRRAARAPKAALRVLYGPTGAVFRSEPGTLEHFLTERYSLFVERGAAIHRLDIEHAPWPLQNGFAEVSVNSMAQAAGFALPSQKPHVLFSRQLQVTAHWPRPA